MGGEKNIVTTPREPRDPKDPVPVAGAGRDPVPSTEPFVRLAMLASRGRAGQSPVTCEERTGALINRASLPEGLDTDGLDRLWERFERDKEFRRRLPLRLPLRWALAAMVLVVSGGVVGAETGIWNWPRVVVRKLTGQPPLMPAPPVATPARLGRKLAAARSVATPSVSPSAATESPAVTEPQTIDPPAAGPPAAAIPSRKVGHAGPTPARLRVDVPATLEPSPAAIPRDTALAEESLLLGRALVRLRQERDPVTALVELDHYAERFPSGMLGHEAQSARVDALLMSGRLGEARTVLSNLTLGTGARDRELRLIRAELTAERACAPALDDYQAVLAESRSGPLAERALWGRAACRARLGDEASARTDLAEYVARFPNGAHAATARARLGN